MEVKDELAVQRTKLANERNLLAYLRSFIVFLGAGITFVKLFPHDRFLQVFGIVLIPVSVIFLILGLISFRRNQRKINRHYNSKEKGQ
ncbi:MAG: DUF202 domain-containing protein [Bacteroidales bacterium]|nr:DUF202 domain-containing protein [Bacteroidales bacterium]MCF8388197.1 DUF202 domain-containing protein [Bacteroidales bacterium]MCF8399026.1 DUF202 domain-containing protein [Bacteroidales bacterium]